MIDKEIIEHLQQHKFSMAIKGLYSVLPLVKKYIAANNGTPTDAEDIFQDALVVLCKKVQSEDFILTAPLKNYLMAIVKNCWLAELRRQKKLPLATTNEEIANTEATDEAGFSAAKAAFDLLGEKCRQLLILFYFKKNSYKEIAAALAFSHEKIAKNQKYRCLQKAKEYYITLSKEVTHG